MTCSNFYHSKVWKNTSGNIKDVNARRIFLSDGNSNAREFQEGIQEATGKTVHIAEPDMTINFDKTPF